MLTLNDGRSELWQWDTGRTLAVDADCSQVHFSNKVFGRSIDVDVNDGVAIIPDILLQTDKELNVWAFVGAAENGYTKISKTFTVNRRNKPADYVFTPTDQTTLDDILDRIEDLEKRPSGGNGGITKEVDPTVPDWAKQPQKPTYTAADVGAIPVPKTATVGQTICVKAVDDAGVPTEWEAADMPSGGGSSLPATGVEDTGKVLTVTEAGVPGWMAYGHWETVLDTVWEQDVIRPTAFDPETGIFTCAEGELDHLELGTEYVFFQQCVVEGAAYNTIINDDIVKVTKISDTTFSINGTPPTTFAPTNVKFSRGTCLAITDIDAKKIRLTLDGQFVPTARKPCVPFFGAGSPYFAENIEYTAIRSAYHAYQQVTAEVESPFRIVGKILCGFNAPSKAANFHFKNNSFCCPLVPHDVPEGHERTYCLTSDGTKIAKLYSTSVPWLLGSAHVGASAINDKLRIISGTRVKLERWVE